MRKLQNGLALLSTEWNEDKKCAGFEPTTLDPRELSSTADRQALTRTKAFNLLMSDKTLQPLRPLQPEMFYYSVADLELESNIFFLYYPIFFFIQHIFLFHFSLEA